MYTCIFIIILLPAPVLVSVLCSCAVHSMSFTFQESYQRCACEILAGMISGSKLWNADMVHMYIRMCVMYDSSACDN